MMRMLSALGTQVRGGLQQALLIWGEAGIGKTRLLTEYLALSALGGGYTTLLSCQAHDVFRPLGIACDLAAQLLEAPGALGCDPEARALLGRLVSANTSVAATREAERIDTPLSAIVRSFNDLVSAVASEGPVLVMIDDAHWLDHESSKVILGVFGRRAARGCWLVTASRERAILAGADAYSDTVSSVRLHPLDSEASRELVRRLLRPVTETDSSRIEGQILKQARGNPFMLRLLCAHFTTSGNAESLEQTVTEILDRRVQQLSAEATRTLEGCVVLAKNCTFARLERLLEIRRRQLLCAIEELDDRGLIEVTDGFIVSSHALLADAVRKRMAATVNKLLHAAAAQLLQQEIDRQYSARLPWDCAEHWRVAGNHAAAIKVLAECARRCMTIGRATDALKTYEHALTVAVDDPVRLEILDGAIEAAWRGLEFTPLREILDMRNVVRTRMGLPIDKHDHAEIMGFAGLLHSDSDPRPNIPRLLDCLTGKSSSPKHVVMAGWQLLMVAELTKDRELAEFAFQAIRDRKGNKSAGLSAALVYHCSFGSIDEGLRLASALREVEPREPDRRVGIRLNVGYAYLRLGDLVEAYAILEDAFHRAQVIQLRNGEVHASLHLANLAWAAEDIDGYRKWHAVLSQLVLERPQPDVGWDYGILSARLAIYDKDFAAAEASIAIATRSEQAQLELPRMLILSCRIDLNCQMGATPCSTEDFDELYALHLRARAFGGNDEVLLSLLRALSGLDRLGEAVGLIRAYESVRRDRIPMRKDLTRTIDEILSRTRMS
jgi:tetratricopeptide (TPR) repeat protein